MQSLAGFAIGLYNPLLAVVVFFLKAKVGASHR